MTRFVLAAGCVVLLVPGCGGSNLVPTGGAASTEGSAFVPEPDTTGTVERVDNAGRLVLTDGRLVSLAGVDLSTGDVCAEEGLAYLRRLTVGGTVAVDACDATGAGATAGMVVSTIEGGRAFVNVELLRSGFAQISGESLAGCGDEAAQARLERAQGEAQAEGRGNFGSGPSACRLPPPTPEPVGGGAGGAFGPRVSPSPRGNPFSPFSPFPMTSPVASGSPLPTATPAPFATPRPVATPLPAASPSPLPSPSPIPDASPGSSPGNGATAGAPTAVR